MIRKKSWGEYDKSFLDKLIEFVRFRVVSGYIKGPSVLDFGCGYEASLLRRIENKIDKGVGIDISVNKKYQSRKINLIESKADVKINQTSESFDTILALAVIEHLDNPEAMLLESYRLLKSGGLLLLTTPGKQSKLLLEFMARINLISKHEIADHKQYFTRDSLIDSLTVAGFKKNKIEIRHFEFGLNIFARAIK